MPNDTSNKPYVIGVDLGGTNVRAAVIDRVSEKIVARGENIPSRAMDGVTATAGQIATAARTALNQGNIDPDRVVGCGIAVPGVIKGKEGIVSYAPNFKDQWRGVQIAGPVQLSLGVPVQIGNDANLAAFGEFRFGSGRGVRDLVMLTLGTGVGGGIIIDGKLIEGATGGAGEIGHMIVNAGGRGGNSSFGSLEGECQRDAIIERAARKIQQGRKTVLGERTDYDRFALTPALIATAAAEGDDVAVEVFEETGYYLGIAVASLINILNPEMIVIGGGIAQAGEILLDSIRRTSNANALRTLARTCQIVPAQLGDNAGIFGGAALALAEIVSED